MGSNPTIPIYLYSNMTSIKNYTKDEFVAKVHKTHLKNPDWRLGQTYFNILTLIDPDISNSISTTIYDPYYNDSNIKNFLVYLNSMFAQEKRYSLVAQR